MEAEKLSYGSIFVSLTSKMRLNLIKIVAKIGGAMTICNLQCIYTNSY